MAAAVAAAVAVVLVSGCTGGSGGGSTTSSGASPSGSSMPAPTSSGAPTSSSSPAPTFKACLVSDEVGWDDRSFNASAYAGLQAAQAEFGLPVLALESTTLLDYDKNLATAVDKGCALIMTVGYRLADATLKAATDNPDIDFAILDYAGFAAAPDNLKSVVFATEQAAFLAGYLAAGMSQTSVVATYGGLPIDAVTVTMSGFHQGAKAYAAAMSKPTDILGWDATDPTAGTYAGGFDDPARGASITRGFIADDADVILPVAGAAGMGTITAAQEEAATRATRVIWVDSDGCVTLPEDCPLFLTSIVKRLDVAVQDLVASALDGTFTSATFVGTLANGALGLAPYHDADGAIPLALKAEIDSLRQQIIDGTLQVNP